MVTKQVNELNFARNRTPVQSIEIRAESLDVSEVLAPVLASHAAANRDELGTVYLYGSMSTTFHEPAWSDFLIVDGTERLRHVVRDAFRDLPGVQCRFSDAMKPTSGRSILHVEGGMCWRVLDAVTWGSTEQPAVQPPAGTDSAPDGAVAQEAGMDDRHSAADDWGDEWDVSEEVDGGATTAKRGRTRAARSDASVGTIRATIETLFGLPAGSVMMCGPDKRPLRADATIGTLRRRWEQG